MFWTEIGNVVKIERAGMDGSERKAVVNSSLGWPGGVAVDAISDRVYWTDIRLKAIGSATLDGDDIRVKHFGWSLLSNKILNVASQSTLTLLETWPHILAWACFDLISKQTSVFKCCCFFQILQMEDTRNPFSLALFNDMLYWSDSMKRVVQAAHKVSGKNRQVLLKRPKQPFGVKVCEMLLFRDNRKCSRSFKTV